MSTLPWLTCFLVTETPAPPLSQVAQRDLIRAVGGYVDAIGRSGEEASPIRRYLSALFGTGNSHLDTHMPPFIASVNFLDILAGARPRLLSSKQRRATLVGGAELFSFFHGVNHPSSLDRRRGSLVRGDG